MLGLAVLIAFISILATTDFWIEGLHWAWNLLVRICRFTILAGIMIAYIAALSHCDSYEDENKILLDILKNDTQPKVEYTIHDGDTLLTDRYFVNPEDTSDYPMRYPISKKARLGIEVEE
jgi:hypothetical protein